MDIFTDDLEPKALGWNSSTKPVNLEDIKMDSNFLMLLSSLVFAIGWVVYITYYNTRVVGFVITKIVNRLFVREGYFHIGSFTLNALSGKIMFRDVIYVTYDYTVRVQDGYLIFRWWRSYVPKDVSEDLSHSDTRLSVVLNGFELHVYNRSDLYGRLEKIFGFGCNIFKDGEEERRNEAQSKERVETEATSEKKRKQRSEAAMARTWRDLIPVIKMDISSARLVFGNRLVPTTLSVTAEESHFVYSTKPAVCTLDRFMHFVKSKAENVRVMLAPSPKYTGMLDEPPRYMGEGFVLMSTNDLELYFYMDEPGLVPDEPVLITLANGDIVESSPPQWGVDIKCGKGTDFSYGPWADRQREHLFKFFYPQDYQPMEVTGSPLPGDKRQMESFDVRLSMQNEATIDILFSKNKETNAVHINVGAGSYLEITLPWVTKPDGYTTKITGQLLHLDATTSLQFRDLVSSETLEFCIACHYPLVWNEHQLWEISLTGCKATVNLVFNHKWFFQDLVDDWSSKQRPDLQYFVPYTWRFGLTLKHCELVTLVNKYNWIDCSSVGQRQRLENTQMALCAHFLHLSFDLPFDEFLPETVPLNFSVQGESIDLSLFIPEFHTSRNVVLNLEKCAKVLSKDGLTTNKKTEIIPKWRNVCQTSNGWVDFWWVPIGAINIVYVYHPSPPQGPSPQADISTPVKEEILLSPMRFPHNRKSRKSPEGFERFDPTTLKADTVCVELEIGPSVLLLYGTALRNFLNLKENIFGEDQMFTDMQEANCSSESQNQEMKEDGSSVNLPLELQENFDHRNFRPLHVDVSVIMHDVQAHLLKYCTEKDPPCPVILVERFGFEMKKRYDETELQLLLSPSVLLIGDNVIRPSKEQHLNQGKITLSSLQVRGHAMFSDVGRSLDEDTIEYAWLIETQLGKLSSKLTAPQLFDLIACLETLVLLTTDAENEPNSPREDAVLSAQRTTRPPKRASSPTTNNLPQHVQQAIQQLLQPKGSGANVAKEREKAEREKERVAKRREERRTAQGGAECDVKDGGHGLKYKMLRVAVDAVDFWLVESGAALQVWLSPLRLSNCNLHGKQVSSGLSCMIYGLSLRQTIWQQHKYKPNSDPSSDLWLEVGALNFDPLIIESAMSSDIRERNLHVVQQRFLRMHDERHKKLWFLWPEVNKSPAKCGCSGGCAFFGGNRNGPRFFRPSRKDLDDGTNIAAFRVNEPGKDPGYGQSILHEGQLIFRTPPYVLNRITLQDAHVCLRAQAPPTTAKTCDSPRVSSCDREKGGGESDGACPVAERRVSRRFSSTSIRSNILKEVPYSRLVETCPAALPAKLDSDSKLHTEKSKLTVDAADVEPLPKNSVSDSKLAVDYFNAPPETMGVVNASESQHSLGVKVSPADGELQKAVQRTVSISSENQSELFFSAEEELNSHSSSLRNSLLSTCGALSRNDSTGSKTPKKFSSELSILTDRSAPLATVAPLKSSAVLTLTPENRKTRLSTHRSDHEIHTPEHRSFNSDIVSGVADSRRMVDGLVTPHHNRHSRRSASPRVAPAAAAKRADSLEVGGAMAEGSLNEDELLSSSDSYSSTSYASAVGSQEDFTLVDLHMQVNRLIVDSSMLMTSYVTHLSQVRCTNWGLTSETDAFSVPLFQKDAEGKLIYIGARFVPNMQTVSEGVTSLKMLNRNQKKPEKAASAYTWDPEDEIDNNDSNEEEFLSSQDDVGIRTCIFVKLKGDLDVMISPLLLEALQRFVDALTPTLGSLHPLTVLNHLHLSCIDQVEAANVLKTTENIANLGNPEGNAEGGSITSESGRCEKIIKTQLQTAIDIPKVNVTILQVSIVEEIISFSALDNIKDLTCVSLFSICLDNVTAKFHSDHQAHEVLQKFLRPSVVQGAKKGASKARHFLGLHTNTNSDVIRGEPVYVESCERQQQQVVFCLTAGKVHSQLRRLRNESSILDDAVITAIPGYCSKVLYGYTKLHGSGTRGVDYYMQQQQQQQLQAEENVSPLDVDFNSEDKLGFIMFECGLEGITIKIVKKTQYEQTESAVGNKKENVACQTGADKSSSEDAGAAAKDAPTNQEQKPTTPKTNERKNDEKTNRHEDNAKDGENISSCVIDLKVVWFNFAAPPRAPITRKIDYTRLDWNLLSTASPAINAWMNPSNRLAIRVVHLGRTLYRRSTATVACLMAEALESQGLHLPAKSRYGKLTPLAKTLQEDPSCQLCCVLQKYYLQSDPATIEANFRETELPQLFTLRQGIIVLSRQWKNILYTPLLSENTVKSKVKPMNVTIAVPEVEEELCFTDGDASANEENDVTDEHAQLLQSGIILRPNSNRTNVGLALKETPSRSAPGHALLTPQVAVVSGGVESVLTSPSPPVPHRKRKKSQPMVPPSSRASVVLPLFANANLFGQKNNCNDNIGYGTLYEDRTINLGSDTSVVTPSSNELPASPLHRSAGQTHSSEDLYSWMAKQDTIASLKGCMESKIDMLQTEIGDSAAAMRETQTAQGVPLYPINDSVRLLDANLVFQPLLSALGVMPQQLRFTTITDTNDGNDVTTLDALGSNLSLVGNMETMKIDIVVSEHGKTEKKKAKLKGKRFPVDKDVNTDESPAFVCEKISVELEVERMTDMAVNDMIKTKNVLYISRGQLKNHTSTVLNFNIGIRYISQRVNMPLLRLLHQISNMYQNVKDTQNELREQQPEITRPKTSASDHLDVKHRSSSVSDFHEPTPKSRTSNNSSKQLALKISDPGSYVSSTNHHRPIVSPSPSVRSRPQSFAQKLRSTGKSVRGYVNLSEPGAGDGTPNTLSSPSGSAIERATISSEKSYGRCWKTVYHLLALYANMPDTKTVKHRFSVGTGDYPEHYKPTRRTTDTTNTNQSTDNFDKPDSSLTKHKKEINSNEHTKLVVFGVARIHRTRLLATLSGLKLEAEITSLHSSLTVRKKSNPETLERSITGQVGRTMIVLLEGVAPNQQTVVKVTVGKSQTIYSSVSKRLKDKNSGLLTIGAVSIDIPQHPVALHGMVTRGSKQLSSTLQELRVTRTSSRLSRGGTQNEEEPSASNQQQQPSPNQTPATSARERTPATVMVHQVKCGGDKGLLQPLVMEFSVILQSLSITAALLPSLQAQYKMDQVNSTGITGSKANFTIVLPHHSLSFTTKLKGQTLADANLPSEASIALPAVHVSAEYIPENSRSNDKAPDGVVFRQGGYLNAHADIGIFEHSLTTDLLNHLVFVQKVFMKEVNEVVQKVYGGERPVPIWLEDTDDASTLNRVLFSLVIRIQSIQLTATTAGSSAVRLETGAVVLELSNRVQNISGSATIGASTVRLFGKAQVDLKVSLGQITRNALFEEADVEYQPVAFFNTRIGLRNAFQDEIVEGEDKEVVLITLKRPLIYVQPVAIDKAILVWLNYKNAYDYWNEKRANLNKEVLTATQQVYEKFQFGQITSQLGSPLSTLFLQLTVEDMGICLPLNPLPLASWSQRSGYEESRGAVVITLENTSISACNSGSLVSKGKFSNLCLRFADDFENSLDDWKPDMSDATIMNLCVVSDGTYEVCSRTIAAKKPPPNDNKCFPPENAKWYLNVQWQMEGVDIHLDTNVGKQLSALGHTLTMLTGAEDAAFPIDYDSDEAEPTDGSRVSQESILPAFVFDPSLDGRKRSKLIEKEMNEQAKIINDLRSLGASHGTIELELKRLHELEAMVYKDFRRDMIQRLRRQSVKASSIKRKFGLGSKSNAYRSKSFIASSPMPEYHGSPENGTGNGTMSGNSASYESSPRSGPSRSASLKVKSPDGPKVTFSDVPSSCRQSSLPSASSELSLPETQIDWAEHLTIDGEKVELRKKMAPYGSVDGSTLMDTFIIDHPSTPLNPLQTTISQTKQQEPNIDLELDVKVFINSGKCVLHSRDLVREEEIKLNKMRKDRSCSAGLLEFPQNSGSPDPTRRNKEKLTLTASSARLRSVPHSPLVDLTIFHIPGMDVKLHYQSKVLTEDNATDQIDSSPPFQSRPAKKSTSDDVRIDNAFKQPKDTPTAAANDRRGISNPNYSPDGEGGEVGGAMGVEDECNEDTFPLGAGGTTPPQEGVAKGCSVVTRRVGMKKASLFAWMTLQSVPEETIISPHILEFLEQTLEPIPPKTNFSSTANSSLMNSDQDLSNYGNYVYASFPVDVIVYFHMQPSTFRFSCLPVSRVECMLQLPSLDIVFSSKRAEDELFYSEFGDGAPNTASTAVGGLSVTGCMSDFSVYIFHPYGGGKKSALKEAQWSPLSDSERKDSLSINVEFVKFHLSRSRMLNFTQEAAGKGKPGTDTSRAVIRFSTITDIGSASFKYDMRRLTEILAFPKAWYRRSIVRRMFLGDLSMTSSHNEDETGQSSQNQKQDSKKSPSTATKDRLRLNLDPDRQSKLKDVGRMLSTESGHSNSPSPMDIKNSTTWETLVLFAVNFKKLNVHMNMGNVMGNVTWLTKDFRSEGRLSIGSTGHKNLYIAFGLGGSGLDAKGGIVGGNIEIAQIATSTHIREEPNIEPDHTIGLKLHALELRLDYMATSVLMCRVSDLMVNLRDEWRLNEAVPSAVFIPTRRPASIFMHGDLSWDQLQIMMSKSSTADLLKMFNKLEEFFSQQFNSSKRAFSGFARTPRVPPQKTKDSWCAQHSQSTVSDARHHRHWQKVLKTVAGLQLSTMHVPLPPFGTILGGTMELHGNNISLACFHGVNFKSKSWALFSLKEPSITFNTEAQEIPSPSAGEDSHDVHVVQTLTCSLGMNSTYKTHLSMATVCKVSRSVIFPPQFKTLQEWFHYAFANSQIDEVDKFPSLEREKSDSMGRGSTASNQRLADPSHNREVIFAVPSLQLHLKTEHLQSAIAPDVNDEKPVVECSFITEFEDHIFVTVDAESFFFLHDLITSYVREKERVLGGGTDKRSSIDTTPTSSASTTTPPKPATATSATASSSPSPSKPTDPFANDFRSFDCKTWHLEPTVRLLSVAGKYIEPYGIDYILQKLGFSHARTTIPKWMQRGFMDPLDAILAVLTLRMVLVLRGDGGGGGGGGSAGRRLEGSSGRGE